MTSFDFNLTYDFLNEVVGISKEALDLAFGLNGCSYETAQDILYWKTGYNNFHAYIEDAGIDIEYL